MFLSIDFEDFAHDLRRVLGVWDTGPLRVDALWRSFETIDAFLRARGGPQGSKATFFCTGVIADQAPDLIAHIAGQGHEIACHYHFHDSMTTQPPHEVDRMLARAKDALEKAANAPVRGFRAPRFHLYREQPEQYKLIERHFSYDSSSFFSSADACSRFARKMALTDLKLVPLYAARFRGRGPKVRLGGSYLKFAPGSVARDLIRQSGMVGIAPHVYLHPYEFSETADFQVSRADLGALGPVKSGYWALRQNQWLRFGGDRLLEKVAALVPPEGLDGRLDDWILQP